MIKKQQQGKKENACERPNLFYILDDYLYCQLYDTDERSDAMNKKNNENNIKIRCCIKE